MASEDPHVNNSNGITVHNIAKGFLNLFHPQDEAALSRDEEISNPEVSMSHEGVDANTDGYRKLDDINMKMHPSPKSDKHAIQGFGSTDPHDHADGRGRLQRQLTEDQRDKVQLTKTINGRGEELSNQNRHMRTLQVSDQPMHRINGSKTAEQSQIPPNTWAILIGINQYHTCLKLNGAVGDVANMENFLTQNGVPHDHVRTLTDNSATRQGILDLLHNHLLNNANISERDSIILHFSGHGSRYPSNGIWWSGSPGFVDALCPVDRGNTRADGSVISDISDREFFLFLEALQSAKKSDITVILDCSFNCPMTRDGTTTTRSTPPLSDPRPMVEEAYNTQWRSDRDNLFHSEWRPDFRGIGVFVACQDYEQAWEKDSACGWFTSALIPSLKKQRTITFRDVIKHIGPLPRADLPRQNPMAYGGRLDEPVFRPYGP